MRSLLLCLCLGFLAGMARAQTLCPPTDQVLPTVTLGWEAPVLVPGQTLTGYVLERQLGTSAWTPLPAPPPTATRASDGPLTVGTTATYRLGARVTQGGTTVPSGWAAWGTPPPCVRLVSAPPAAAVPTAFLATTQCSTQCVALSWTSPDPQRPVVIERIPLPGEDATWRVQVTGTGYTLTDMVPGKERCFRIQYAAGTTWSPQVCATPKTR